MKADSADEFFTARIHRLPTPRDADCQHRVALTEGNNPREKKQKKTKKNFKKC